jgi:PEGA domain
MSRAFQFCSCLAVLLGWQSGVRAELPTPAASDTATPSSAAGPASSAGVPAPVSPSPSAPEGAAPPPPLADSLQGEAKNDYEAGHLLFDTGDYPRALLMFQNAYQLSADPRLLWNAAGCERNLQHYVKASNLVRQLLASHSVLVSPELAIRAQAFLDAADPLSAPLEVESNQANAEVYLDDELLGTPELASHTRVDLGTHRLVVKERGFQPFTQTLTVTSSAKVHVTALLRALAVPLPVPAPKPLGSARAEHSAALPLWVWVAGGGVVLAAGIVTAGYFIFKPSPAPQPVSGSIATWRF